ncbi:unnamed protein product [Scytosiphon promiscuus]
MAEHDPDDDDRDSAASSHDEGSGVGEGKDDVGGADEDDSATSGNTNSTGVKGSGRPESLPTQIRHAIRDKKDAETERLLKKSGGVDAILQTYVRRSTSNDPHLDSGTCPVLHAATAGDLATFKAVLSVLKPSRMPSVLNARDNAGTTLLLGSVRNNDVRTFEEVLRQLNEGLEPTELRSSIKDKDKDGETLLSAAVQADNIETFGAALECVWSYLGHHQRCSLIKSKNKGGVGMLSSATSEAFSQKLWSKALESGHLGLFESMISVVPEQHRKKLKEAEAHNSSLLWWALEYGDGRLWTHVVGCSGELEKVADQRSLNEVLAACITKHIRDENPPDTELDTLFSIMSSCARPSSNDLKLLLKKHSAEERLQKSCLSAITSATNPFIAGMYLSAALTKVAKTAIEAKRRKLLEIETRVDALLLEIFERLPQTVRGFHQGMDGCTAVLEPFHSRDSSEDPEVLGGPLTQMFAAREQAETFCSVPLVMDFLSRRFTLGLPNPTDSDEVLKDSDELKFLDEGLTDEYEHHLVVRSVKASLKDDDWLAFGFTEYPLTMLQGASDKVPRLTFLPGVQFVLAGLIAMPRSYYRVPATRMALDVVLYTYFIVVVSVALLFQEDGLLGANNRHVYVAIVFVAGGVLREVEEFKDGVGKYFKDRWNFFDVPGLLCLTAGMIAKLIPGGKDYPVGKAFFALSAPLLVSRFLFFAQLLPMQGPMVQVIFSMAKPLIQFGVVMAVVMIGFAMSFHVLFQESESFGETFLSLFSAMLGDADFDTFSGGPHDLVATVLLVAYIVIMAIMLLNLLVAVLSTSHARVQENNEREFKVLQAGIFNYYRKVVKDDTLPAPFNLLQLVVKPCAMFVASFKSLSDHGQTENQVHRKAAEKKLKATLGRVIFTLFMGPLAVAAGALLWFTSFPYAMFQLHKCGQGEDPGEERKMEAAGKNKEAESAEHVVTPNKGRYIIVLAWCILGAPLCLLFLFVLRLVGLFPPCVGLFRSACATREPSSFWFRVMRLLFPNEASRRTRTDDGGDPPGDGGSTQGSTDKTKEKLTVEEMLIQAAPAGVGAEDLRRFLDDPMSDTEVRADERERQATVQHVKLLRQRLEKTSKKEVIKLQGMIEVLWGAVEAVSRKLDEASLGQAAGDGQKPTTSGDCSSH